MIACAKDPPYREDTRNNKLVGLFIPYLTGLQLTYSRNRKGATHS